MSSTHANATLHPVLGLQKHRKVCDVCVLRRNLGPIPSPPSSFLHGPSMPVTPEHPSATDADSNRRLRRKRRILCTIPGCRNVLIPCAAYPWHSLVQTLVYLPMAFPSFPFDFPLFLPRQLTMPLGRLSEAAS